MGKKLEADASAIWDELFCLAGRNLTNEEQREVIRKKLCQVACFNYNRGIRNAMDRVKTFAEYEHDTMQIQLKDFL